MRLKIDIGCEINECIGKNIKRDLNSRAKEFGIKPEIMQAFFKTVVRDLLDVAFN